MATADYTAYEAVFKEVHTSDSLEKQFYSDDPLLDAIEKFTPKTSIGDKAITPVHTGRAGGYSAVPRTGTDSLNAADSQEVTEATWNYTHHWKQIAIETAAIDESDSKAKAIASVVNTEVDGAVSDLRKQVTRQAFSNGDALIAQCTTTTASTTVQLLSTGYGYDALVRGWLYPGQQIDIGTTANETAIAADRTITAVSESSSAPTITIDGAAVTTDNTHYISIANARSGATSYEMNGLRNLIGTGTVGGINPATYPGWQSYVDSSTTTLSLPALRNLEKKVYQKSGRSPDWAITGVEQWDNAYGLVQSQVRYVNSPTGDNNKPGSGLDFGGVTLIRHPDCPDRNIFVLTKKDLLAITNDKPDWAPRKYGNGSILEWKQGSTRMVSALVYRLQLGLKRRNTHAAATTLSN